MKKIPFDNFKDNGFKLITVWNPRELVPVRLMNEIYVLILNTLTLSNT